MPLFPLRLPPSGPIWTLSLSVQLSWSGSRLSPCVCASLEVTVWPLGCPQGSEEKPALSSDSSLGGVAHTSQLGVQKTVPLDCAEDGATMETVSSCALHVPRGTPEHP